MNRILKMYGTSIRISVASAITYRLDFFINMLIMLAENLVVPLVTILIYGAGASFPGWNMYEALLIQSVFMLCTGMGAPFFYNMVWVTMEYVREGNYDLLLIKPCSPIITTLSYSFELEGLGVLIGGVAMFIYALCKLPSPSMMNWLSFVFLIMAAFMLLLGMILIMAASTFKWVGNSRIFEIFDSISQFGRYPVSIFPKWLISIITYIIPIGIIGFYPASAILGKIQPFMFLSAIPCFLFMILGIFVFRRMIQSYQSAGG